MDFESDIMFNLHTPLESAVATRRPVIGLLGQFDPAVIRRLEGCRIVVPKDSSSQSILETMMSLHGLIIRSPFKLSADCAHAAKHLRWIVRAGSGTDNISPAFSEMGVELRTTPANSYAVAELVLTLTLSLLRRVRPAHDSLKEGEWRKNDLVGSELRHQSVGILGFGRIGQEVARLLRLFSTTVYVFDRNPLTTEKSRVAADVGATFLGIDEVLARSKILVCCLPETPETRGLFDLNRLMRMPVGALLVNVGRGTLIDLEALESVLDAGRMGGVALDVFPKEPPGRLKLFARDNVICTPHLGAQTHEAHRRIGAEVIRHLDELMPTAKAEL